MDFSNPNDPMLLAAISSTLCVISVILLLMEHEENESREIAREPSEIRQQWRDAHMYRILWGGQDKCVSYLRMTSSAFYTLVSMLRSNGSLRDTRWVCVEEQLAMFLYMLGHKSKNRVCTVEFVRSGETISRYFNLVLGAIFSIRERVLYQPGSETPIEIRENCEWFPYFKVMIIVNLVNDR